MYWKKTDLLYVDTPCFPYCICSCNDLQWYCLMACGGEVLSAVMVVSEGDAVRFHKLYINAWMNKVIMMFLVRQRQFTLTVKRYYRYYKVMMVNARQCVKRLMRVIFLGTKILCVCVLRNQFLTFRLTLRSGCHLYNNNKQPGSHERGNRISLSLCPKEKITSWTQ